MANPIITQGPGNKTPDTETKSFLAGAAIAEGDVVQFTAADTTGYTVSPSDTGTANGNIGIGVAKEDIAAGEWGEIIVKGFCPNMTTNGSVVAGSALTTSAGGGAAAPGTVGTHHIFGIALAADVGTVLSAAIIFKQV